MSAPKLGQRKSTAAEIEARVEFVIELLAAGHRHGAVKSKVREKFGPVSARQCFRYMSRAHALLAKECERPRAELLALAVEFYNSILRDAKAPYGAKISARERLDKLFGLETAQKFELAGAEFGPLQLSRDEALEKVYGDALFPPPTRNGNDAPA